MIKVGTRHPTVSPFRIVWRFISSAPLPVATQALLRTMNALRPGLTAFIASGFINALVQRQDVLKWTLAYSALTMLELLTDILSGPVREWVRSAAIMSLQSQVLETSSAAPLASYLDSSFHDLIYRANRELPERLIRWFDSLMYVTHSSISILGLMGTLVSLGGNLVLAAAIISGCVARLLVQGPIAKLDANQSQQMARPRRLAAKWSELLSSRLAAPEVRLFGLQGWLYDRWVQAYEECAKLDALASKKRASWNGIGAAVAVASFSAVVALSAEVGRHAGPGRGVGVFTGLLLANQLLQAYVLEAVAAIGRLRGSSAVISELSELFTVSRECGYSSARTPRRPVGVRLQNVSFRYPGAQSDAVRSVTEIISPGQVVALVGPNGAGKTTLASLILNLYQPTSGEITLVDDCPGDGPRGSAVFQEFVRYALTVRDNVGFGDLSKIGNEAAIRKALRAAGSELESELDVWLTPEFGGRDLSGGEWLRLAVARGLLPDSGLSVLDEPTAAIDPRTEVELLGRLLDMHRGRTVVVISHRLGIARMADRIWVMDRGRIVEQGTHEELLAVDGLYRRMWNAQASWYLDPVVLSKDKQRPSSALRVDNEEDASCRKERELYESKCHST